MTERNEISRGWALILSACTGVIFSSIVLPYYSIGALVVPVTEAFGWTRAQFQAAILFSSGLGAVTAPVVGWLCDRFGARTVALPGLVGLSAGFLLAANMSGELWTLYLAYGAMAVLGAGTIPVTWTRAITTNFFRQRGLALGLALTGTGICGVFIPHYATWLVESFGWRAAYAGIALLPLFIAGPVVFFGFRPKESMTDADASAHPVALQGMTLRQAAHGYRFWVLLLSIFVVYMAASGIGPNLYPAVTDAGMSVSEAASVQSVFGGAIVAGRVIVGFLVDRIWAPAVASASMLLPVMGCWLLMEPSGFTTAALGAFLIGFAAGAELDLMSFFTAKYFGLRHYAQIYAVLYMALAVCSGTAPMLFAALFDATASYGTSFALAGGLFGLGAILVLFLGPYPVDRIPATDSRAHENTGRSLSSQ